MDTITETIAVLATLFFCNGDARLIDSDRCNDGSPKQMREIKLLSSRGTVVQIKSNEAVLFELRFDGSVFSDLNFKADPEAIRFWQALGDALPDVCQAFAGVSRPQVPQ